MNSYVSRAMSRVAPFDGGLHLMFGAMCLVAASLAYWDTPTLGESGNFVSEEVYRAR